MPEEYELAIGELVEEHYGGRNHHQGTVRTIGPKHIHVENHGRITRYLRETQQRSDGYPGYFMTATQRDQKDRMKVAVALLRTHGIESLPRANPSWTTDQLERLAKAVETIRTPVTNYEEWPS